MEADRGVSPITRKSLAHAIIDFLDGTKQRLDELAINARRIELLNVEKRPVETGLLAQGLQEEAIRTANEMFTALGGVAIRLPSDGVSNRQQIVRLTAIRDFVSPEGPPTWLVSASPTQFGVVAIEFHDARERLHEY